MEQIVKDLLFKMVDDKLKLLLLCRYGTYGYGRDAQNVESLLVEMMNYTKEANPTIFISSVE